MTIKLAKLPVWTNFSSTNEVSFSCWQHCKSSANSYVKIYDICDVKWYFLLKRWHLTEFSRVNGHLWGLRSTSYDHSFCTPVEHFLSEAMGVLCLTLWYWYWKLLVNALFRIVHFDTYHICWMVLSSYWENVVAHWASSKTDNMTNYDHDIVKCVRTSRWWN